MFFCRLILQGKSCWFYWKSNLIELLKFGLNPDLNILKFVYFVYVQDNFLVTTKLFVIFN